MGMISRYKKSGGFKQLLELVETSGKIKQEKFLKIIEDEDIAWAETIQQKMLTIDRIFSWDDNILSEIFSRLKDITLAISFHILTEEQWERVTKTFSHAKLRNLRDAIDEKKVTVAEKNTSIVNILTEVRKMISLGMIRLDAIDPDLFIDDEIEEKLSMKKTRSKPNVDNSIVNLITETKASTSNTHDSSEGITELRKELMNYKKKIIALGNEIYILRKENESLHNKIDQITKLIAA